MLRKDVSKLLKLRDFESAVDEILYSFRIQPKLKRIKVLEALDKVAGERILCKVDIPGRAVAMMDGYALSSSSTLSASPSNPAVLKISTGDKISEGEARYIHTGEELPVGSDCIARVEETRYAEDKIYLNNSILKGKNIMNAGDDIKAGEVLVDKGDVLNSPRISLLIAQGISEVKVVKEPVVGIISVGKELRSFEEMDDGRQINNFAYLMAGYLKKVGAKPVVLGVYGDAEGRFSSYIEKKIRDYDGMITIGRSSVGKNDFVLGSILSSNNVKLIFHGVKLLPVRPSGVASVKGKPLWMLPAHAVSAAISFCLFVAPVINSIYSRPAYNTILARSSSDIKNERNMPVARLVDLYKEDGILHARPLRFGSNLMSSLIHADGFTILQPRSAIEEGDYALVYRLDSADSY